MVNAGVFLKRKAVASRIYRQPMVALKSVNNQKIMKQHGGDAACGEFAVVKPVQGTGSFGLPDYLIAEMRNEMTPAVEIPEIPPLRRPASQYTILHGFQPICWYLGIRSLNPGVQQASHVDL